MKQGIHPQWYPDAIITCNCGNTFKIGSTKPEFNVEICSKCHPFLTGEQRFADTRGKVKIFEEKMKKGQENAPLLAKKKAKKAHMPQNEQTPKSLKEMLMGA